ncbi:MAG: hypothetical protein BWK79_15190 [Beggiatoa sp. IS2]|nr:MAG: hypothetical protein BWK79_15190 [Beggiatoa sp. IS2]
MGSADQDSMNNLIAEKVTEYLKLYQVDVMLLPQLTQQVVQRVNLRLLQEDCEFPLEIAIEEAQKVMDTWLVEESHLPATTEQILLARLRRTVATPAAPETRLSPVPLLAPLSMMPQEIEFWSLWRGLVTLLRYILSKVIGLFTFIWATVRGRL